MLGYAGLVSQLQVEEILFMADRNFKALPGDCCGSLYHHCICQMIEIYQPTDKLNCSEATVHDHQDQCVVYTIQVYTSVKK